MSSSAPRRWKDSPDAPVGMRELLGSARPTRPLDEGTFRRNATRVAKLSVAPAAAAATISIWAKLAAAGAIGLAATGAVVAVEIAETRHPDPPAPAPVIVTVAPVTSSTAPTEPAPSESAPSDSTSVETQPEPPKAAAPAARTPTPTPVLVPEPVPTPEEAPGAPPPSPKTSTLASELLLLEDARAYASRDPSIALARLAEHRQRHPGGLLAAERDLMELDLLRRTGRVQEARDRAKAWLARDPNGMHSARVREILASLDAQ